MRPYFELNTVLEKGVFNAASRLYGVTFHERTDLYGYHPDVRVFEVRNEDGSPLGLFLGDFHARASKRGGAWMNSLVRQSGLEGTRPVVVNNLNIVKGEPTLMTFDEVNTMFHEFGHALHGLFSDVRHPRFSGTAVPRDFVEYPSQVNEMWATHPEILAEYARHHETGEPMPQDLVDRMLETQKFNQGFATLEYLAATLLDWAWHTAYDGEEDVEEFERRALREAGVDLAGRPAALPQHLLRPHLGGRLQRLLLLLHLERGPRRRHRRVVQRERRAAPGERRHVPPGPAVPGRQRRLDDGVPRLPGPRPGDHSPARPPRAAVRAPVAVTSG